MARQRTIVTQAGTFDTARIDLYHRGGALRANVGLSVPGGMLQFEIDPSTVFDAGQLLTFRRRLRALFQAALAAGQFDPDDQTE